MLILKAKSIIHILWDGLTIGMFVNHNLDLFPREKELLTHDRNPQSTTSSPYYPTYSPRSPQWSPASNRNLCEALRLREAAPRFPLILRKYHGNLQVKASLTRLLHLRRHFAMTLASVMLLRCYKAKDHHSHRHSHKR
jgi:hypothetical protein